MSAENPSGHCASATATRRVETTAKAATILTVVTIGDFRVLVAAIRASGVAKNRWEERFEGLSFYQFFIYFFDTTFLHTLDIKIGGNPIRRPSSESGLLANVVKALGVGHLVDLCVVSPEYDRKANGREGV